MGGDGHSRIAKPFLGRLGEELATDDKDASNGHRGDGDGTYGTETLLRDHDRPPARGANFTAPFDGKHYGTKQGAERKMRVSTHAEARS